MIIIPELQKIVILVPRTASGSLRRAIAKQYPKSFLLYRHMEADGVPHGYNFWEKVGVVRNPLDRLWSLYKFLQNPPSYKLQPDFSVLMKNSVTGISFNNWILENKIPFGGAFNGAETQIYPEHSTLHSLPETRKSQFIYLRPDLGTKIFSFTELKRFTDYLGVNLDLRENATPNEEPPPLSDAARAHMWKYFLWDYTNA